MCEEEILEESKEKIATVLKIQKFKHPVVDEDAQSL